MRRGEGEAGNLKVFKAKWFNLISITRSDQIQASPLAIYRKEGEACKWDWIIERKSEYTVTSFPPLATGYTISNNSHNNLIRGLWLLSPLTTARLREVECSSENIRLGVTSQVHCCTVSEVGWGRQHFVNLFCMVTTTMRLSSHFHEISFKGKKATLSRTNQPALCKTMPSRLCFNSGTQYVKENKVELNVALGRSKERKTKQTSMCKLIYRFANIINKILNQ